MKPEAQFERDLAISALLTNCQYIKIPDTKMINAKNRHLNREQKRPFDGILITPKINVCIECKYNYNQLEGHQKDFGRQIEDINGQWCVFRKVKLTHKTVYRVEKSDGKVLFETEKIEEMIKYVWEE